jgi:hypothetical protein
MSVKRARKGRPLGLPRADGATVRDAMPRCCARNAAEFAASMESIARRVIRTPWYAKE